MNTIASYVDKFFAPTVLRFVERTKEGDKSKYLHQQLLRKQFSVSGRWDNLTSLNARVAADVVSLDSTLPLKARPALRRVDGEIIKMGMKRRLSESDMVQINTLMSLGRSETEVLSEILKDVPHVISGVYERLEGIFLEGLSSGVASVDEDSNVGTGIRIDYGYFDENKLKVTELWTADTAKPLSDLERVQAVARLNGHSLRYVYMDRATFNAFAKNNEVRTYMAGLLGFALTGKNTPVPSLPKVNEALGSDPAFGLQIRLIERSIMVEKDGIRTPKTPWEAGKVILSQEEQVGKLVWAETAEAVYPVSGKNYQKADEYILVSQWRENEPLSEITTSQARVIPVICNVESIYQLDTLAKE